jgi:hypothetical protein
MEGEFFLLTGAISARATTTQPIPPLRYPEPTPVFREYAQFPACSAIFAD